MGKLPVATNWVRLVLVSHGILAVEILVKLVQLVVLLLAIVDRVSEDDHSLVVKVKAEMVANRLVRIIDVLDYLVLVDHEVLMLDM